MSHASARVKVVTGPMELAPGVFSIGPIARSLWLMGLTREQALAVNVEGKGIVLIIGCGHQTLERAVARTETLFDAPLYGVIGGLHFPVTGSRMPYGMQTRHRHRQAALAASSTGATSRRRSTS